MLAARVNARKYDNLRITLGIVWKLGLGLCEAHLGWFLIAIAVARGAPGMIPAVDLPPPIVCWLEL